MITTMTVSNDVLSVATSRRPDLIDNGGRKTSRRHRGRRKRRKFGSGQLGRHRSDDAFTEKSARVTASTVQGHAQESDGTPAGRRDAQRASAKPEIRVVLIIIIKIITITIKTCTHVSTFT